MTKLNLNPPSPITADQELTIFDSGELSLNEWLKKRALKNQATGVSRCFVESPIQPVTLMMTIETVRSILAEFD